MTSVGVRPGHIKRPQGGGPQPCLTETDVERAKELARKGRRLSEIAAELYVHPSTVSRYLQAAGVSVPRRPPPARRIDPDELLRTTQLAGQGFSASDIGELLGRHPTTIRLRLRHHARDINWRGRSSALARKPAP